MGPFGAFQEITDRIQTNPPWSGEGGSALNQPSEPRKPGEGAGWSQAREALFCHSGASPRRTWQVGSLTRPV